LCFVVSVVRYIPTILDKENYNDIKRKTKTKIYYCYYHYYYYYYYYYYY